MSCSRGLGLLCARPVCVRYPSTLPAPVPSQSPPRDLGASHSLTIAALSRAAVCFVRSMALDKELQAAQLLEYHTSLHSAASRLGEECWLRRLERRCFGLRCRKLGRERPVRALFVRAVRGALVTPSGRRGRRPTLGGGPANGVGDHISGCEITGDRRVNGLQRPTRQRRGVAFERRPGYACQYAHGGPQGGAHWRWCCRRRHLGVLRRRGTGRLRRYGAGELRRVRRHELGGRVDVCCARGAGALLRRRAHPLSQRVCVVR